MTVNKGLKTLVNSTPDFSNQALENAINEIKNVDKDDGYLWIKSAFDMDTAIHDNTVLTTTQKNDALETLYNAQPHLQIGRYLNDVIRHTDTILDGSIIPGDSTITGTPEDQGQGTFLELLQSVQTIQNTIPDLYGVPASEKNRDVNDHFGSINNKFLETEDSSAPVFTRLKQTLELIDTNSRRISALATATAAVRFSNNALVTFLNSLVADSTDFQTSLDNAVNTAAGNMANLHNRVAALPGDRTISSGSNQATILTAIREEIENQRLLEISNLSGIRTYLDSLTDNTAYATLAEDTELRKLMSRVAQNTSWQTYFNDYEKNLDFLNPKYDTTTDSDKASIIEQILREKGLPDVLDHIDIVAVSNKAIKNNRINTAGFAKLTEEQIIKKCCEQLSIRTDGTVYNQSERLLNNLNAHDRQVIADAIDFNEDSNTLS
tara:strand:+ start:262 stop:1569 length:1308 start_codon:yes stop_codon:yes gene_type:complete